MLIFLRIAKAPQNQANNGEVYIYTLRQKISGFMLRLTFIDIVLLCAHNLENG